MVGVGASSRERAEASPSPSPSPSPSQPPRIILRDDEPTRPKQIERTNPPSNIVTSPSKADLLTLLSPSVLAAHLSRLGTHRVLSSPHLFSAMHQSDQALRHRAQQAVNCTICESVISAILPLIETNSTLDIIEWAALNVCKAMKPMCHSPAACEEMCEGLIGEYKDQVWILIIRLATPQAICHLLHECPLPPKPDPSKAIPVKSDLRNLAGEQSWPSWEQKAGVGTFIHFSDAHIDTTYTVGANSDCGLPLCCQPSDGPGTSPNTTAGYWGDYNCDTPPHLAKSLLQSMQTQLPPPDFILYTGDDAAHDVWKQSRAGNLESLEVWSQIVNDELAAPLKVPVFHTLGNHEIFPVNQFEGPVFDSWLYDAAVAAWSVNLPDDAKTTMSYGGYYQARARPGLRVISLNSNYFTDDNFWLLANQTDAENQLNWLANVLEQMSGPDGTHEKAIIICHHPLKSWRQDMAEAFINITQQHRQTIVNMFMGHTHHNQYATVSTLDEASPTPMFMSFIGGSVVPFTNLNPGFLQYTYDRSEVYAQSDYQQLVHEAYPHWLDLPAANANNDTASWVKPRYSLAQQLGVASLSAKDLFDLGPSYLNNATLLTAYQDWYFKGASALNDPLAAQYVFCMTTFASTDGQYHQCMNKQGVNVAASMKMEEEMDANC